MLEFTVNIDQEKFDKLNVDLQFNKNLYGELIDESFTGPVPEGKELNIHVSPWAPLLEPTAAGRLSKVYRRETRSSGEYLFHGELHTHPRDNQLINNINLLHETKHWLDDISGEFTEEKQKARLAQLRRKVYTTAGATAVAEVSTSAITYAATHSLSLAAGAFISVSLATFPLLNRIKRQIYATSPHELAAQEFAGNPDRLKRFGNIITYTQLDESRPMWALAA
jgi:hypothetical protein